MGSPVSIHRDFFRQAVPDWLTRADPARVASLQTSRIVLPDWAKALSEAQQADLKSAISASWSAQTAVDKMFAELKDAYAFAEPLLRQKLIEMYGVDVDVKETFLRLYRGGVGKTLSLLDAALQNFSKSDEFEDSNYMGRPAADGRYEIKPIEQKMTIRQFTQLCRTLDLGKQYQDYLNEYMNVSDPFSVKVVKLRIIESHRCAFKAALELARLRDHISPDAYRVANGLYHGQKNLFLDGAPVRFYNLQIMDSRLFGIVLIAPDLQAPASGNRRVIAYVPHDPEHPLKEYPSSLEFLNDLTRKLRDTSAPTDGKPSYQQFFSQFVAHRQRGHFFANLRQRLNKVIWHPYEPGSNVPSWRETPVESPRLHFGVLAFGDDNIQRFRGDLWEYLYEQQLNKIFSDARELLISTADADDAAYWHWIDDLENILSEVFQAALMVVTPFVPFLGEVMLAYTVYQLTSEVVEGVVDLSEGQYAEAGEHLIGVVQNLAQVAAFGAAFAGAKLVLSPLIENAVPVTLSSGKQRLWTQNLEPYQHDLSLPAEAKPDARGLHQHQGKSVLRLDDVHYQLKSDPQNNQFRLVHPQRPDTYQPQVRHNGMGAFVIEGERPSQWNEQTLMARLGPEVDGLQDAGPVIRIISDSPVSAMRRMYANNEPTLPLLSDTLTRMRIDRSLQSFSEQIASSRPEEYLQADIPTQLQLLDGLWPSERRVRVLAADGRTSLGDLGSSSMRREQVYADQLLNQDLLQTLLALLSEEQTEQLIVGELGAAMSTLQENAQSLRTELARRASQKRGHLFERRYAEHERQWGAPVQLVCEQVPGLPGAVAQELLAIASPEELRAVAEGRLPARLEGLARFALEEVRVARAYEGIYLASVESFDTDKLVLHSVENLPGWPKDLRIQVRRYGSDGQLLDSIGPQEARLLRTIVVGADGDFEVLDEQGAVLGERNDFHGAILLALPDVDLMTLGFARNQVQGFKQAVRGHLLAREKLPQVLGRYPETAPPPYDPRLLRLRGGAPEDVRPLSDAEMLNISGDNLLFYAYGNAQIPPAIEANYRQAISLVHERFGIDGLNNLETAYVEGVTDTLDMVILRQSIESLPELRSVLAPEKFSELLDNLIQRPTIPLAAEQRALAQTGRYLQATGRMAEYQALLDSVREGEIPADVKANLADYAELLGQDPVPPTPIIEVDSQTMANLRLAQQVITRSRELLPLSGNQLPSIWEKGGSVIAKLKNLRKIDLATGLPTANLTIAEAARGAIEIKGGNCSENSKVTFSILASQPRDSAIHIVRAPVYDHQFVLIGDLNGPEEQLVVADSWPEFPSAHLVSECHFVIEGDPVISLPPGPAIAEYSFIDETAPGPAVLPPRGTDDSTLRSVKVPKLHVRGAYVQWTSLKKLGSTYTEPQGQAVSFQRHDALVIERRIDAYDRYLIALGPVK
mgnify:CR=1 FL=1